MFDEDLNRRNEIHCRYMMGLGHLGLGDRQFAEALFREVFAAESHHSRAAFGALQDVDKSLTLHAQGSL